MKSKKALRILHILIIVGFFLSLYLSIQHYKPLGEGEECDISDTINCSIVNKSKFAEIFGIPVAEIGMAWFLIMGYLLHAGHKKRTILKKPATVWAYHWSIMGVLSIGYFVWAEWYLGALCIYCTIVHIILITIFLMLLFNRRKK